MQPGEMARLYRHEAVTETHRTLSDPFLLPFDLSTIQVLQTEFMPFKFQREIRLRKWKFWAVSQRQSRSRMAL